MLKSKINKNVNKNDSPLDDLLLAVQDPFHQLDLANIEMNIIQYTACKL